LPPCDGSRSARARSRIACRLIACGRGLVCISLAQSTFTRWSWKNIQRLITVVCDNNPTSLQSLPDAWFRRRISTTCLESILRCTQLSRFVLNDGHETESKITSETWTNRLMKLDKLRHVDMTASRLDTRGQVQLINSGVYSLLMSKCLI
jgi:hypothetical protein